MGVTGMTARYHLTIDLDWAPDTMISLCLDLLDDAGIMATFFTTHHTDLNEEILRQGHELGIHPNFLPGSSHGTGVSEIVDTCLSFAPEARYMRTHALVQSTPLLAEIFDGNLQLMTDVSLLMHGVPNVRRGMASTGSRVFERILYNWQDSDECLNRTTCFGDSPPEEGSWIFNFHPIHVGLNSTDGSEYRTLCDSLGTRSLKDAIPAETDRYVRGGVGTRTFFESILEAGAEMTTMEEI